MDGFWLEWGPLSRLAQIGSPSSPAALGTAKAGLPLLPVMCGKTTECKFSTVDGNKKWICFRGCN